MSGAGSSAGPLDENSRKELIDNTLKRLDNFSTNIEELSDTAAERRNDMLNNPGSESNRKAAIIALNSWFSALHDQDESNRELVASFLRHIGSPRNVKLNESPAKGIEKLNERASMSLIDIRYRKLVILNDEVTKGVSVIKCALNIARPKNSE